MPQSGCAPRRGSSCSYSAVPSNRASAHSSRGKCAGTQSSSTPMPGRVERVDERPEVVRSAERRLRREVAADLISPRRRVRMLHHRHQLDVREAELGHVRHELLGEIPPREPLAPRAGVHLVDGERVGERVGDAAVRQPVGVRPREPAAVDDRRVLRRHLGKRGVRVGLESGDPVGPDDRELVALPLGGIRGDALPDPGGAERAQRVGALAPEVPVADGRHRPRVRRPDREPHPAFLQAMRPETLVEPLVSALAGQVEVDLAESRHDASSRRSRPATGIPTQSGRLVSSYRSS